MDRSPLQKLPPELRLLIIEYTITSTDPVIIEKREKDNEKLRCDRSHIMALTCTCKQLRHECGNLFYTCNTFRIKLSDKSRTGAQEAQYLVRWFESLKQDQAKALRAIVIEVGREHFFPPAPSWTSDLLRVVWQTINCQHNCRVHFRPIYLDSDRPHWAGTAEVLTRTNVTLDVKNLASSSVHATESLSARMDDSTCQDTYHTLYWARCHVQAMLKLGGPHIQG